MEGEVEFSGDKLIDQIDWHELFDDFPESANVLDSEFPASSPASGDSVSPSASSLIDEIEKVLMKDDEDDDNADLESSAEFCENFLADILIDSPNIADSEHDASTDEAATSGKENLDQDANDPISKRHRRQMRNRDAAVKSRERKKVYVKDLEMKSRYFEGECRRLGRLLQCCYAENQALRFTMQMGAACASKQESAVLFLESLLLGSLLWWVASLVVKPSPESEGPNKAPLPQPQVAPRRESELETSEDAVTSLLVKSRRRCKAFSPKIKHPPPYFLILGSVCV